MFSPKPKNYKTVGKSLTWNPLNGDILLTMIAANRKPIESDWKYNFYFSSKKEKKFIGLSIANDHVFYGFDFDWKLSNKKIVENIHFLFSNCYARLNEFILLHVHKWQKRKRKWWSCFHEIEHSCNADTDRRWVNVNVTNWI